MSFSEGATLKTTWTYLDVLIAVCIVLFGVYWMMGRTDTGAAARRVLIHKDGAVIASASLMDEGRIDLSAHGVPMVVEVRGGRVRVLSSSCKQQVCVRKGWTAQAHDPIICLPNRITIEVTGTDPRYDAISR